jgi:hypothetical protein
MHAAGLMSLFLPGTACMGAVSCPGPCCHPWSLSCFRAFRSVFLQSSIGLADGVMGLDHFPACSITAFGALSQHPNFILFSSGTQNLLRLDWALCLLT